MIDELLARSRIVQEFKAIISTLIYPGLDLWRNKNQRKKNGSKIEKGSLMGGFVATAANPYFFLWWATVGLTLIPKSPKFGLIGLALFVAVHSSCDLGWDLFLSRSAFGAERILRDFAIVDLPRRFYSRFRPITRSQISRGVLKSNEFHKYFTN